MTNAILCPCCGNDKFVLCESFGGRDKLQCTDLKCLCAFYPEAINPARVAWEHFRAAMESLGNKPQIFIDEFGVMWLDYDNNSSVGLHEDEIRALGWAEFARGLADE